MTTASIKNIFLTLDVSRPNSEEHSLAVQLIKWLSKELSDFAIPTTPLIAPAPPFPLEVDPHGWFDASQWAKRAYDPSLVDTYDQLSGYRLTPGSLVVAADLPPSLQDELDRRGVPWVVIRQVPDAHHEWILLAKANFSLPEKWAASMPPIQSHLPSPYQFGPRSAVFVGIPAYHADRLYNGSAIHLRHHLSEILPIQRNFPNLYYHFSPNHDKNEVDFFSSIGATPVSVPIIHVLSSPSVEHLFSVDSSIAPLAATYKKPFTRLVSLPAINWRPLALRWFRSQSFIMDLLAAASRDVSS